MNRLGNPRSNPNDLSVRVRGLKADVENLQILNHNNEEELKSQRRRYLELENKVTRLQNHNREEIEKIRKSVRRFINDEKRKDKDKKD